METNLDLSHTMREAKYQQKIIALCRTEMKLRAKASAITDLLLSQTTYLKSPIPSPCLYHGSKSDPVDLISTVPCVPLFSKIFKTISLVLDVMRC
jgi:hypothetical protein